MIKTLIAGLLLAQLTEVDAGKRTMGQKKRDNGKKTLKRNRKGNKLSKDVNDNVDFDSLANKKNGRTLAEDETEQDFNMIQLDQMVDSEIVDCTSTGNCVLMANITQATWSNNTDSEKSDLMQQLVNSTLN